MLRKILSLVASAPILGVAWMVNAADLPDCTEVALRAAIAQGGEFTFACDGTITLTSQIVITNQVTLDAGSHAVVLSGGGNGRIFQIEAGGNLTLRGIRLLNGRATTGGAIHNLGTLHLEDCVLSQHSAIGPDGPSDSEGTPGRGGAVANDGMLSATSCIFSNNTAQGGKGGSYSFIPGGLSGGEAEGGAIRSFGTTYLTNCQFTANRAVGGIGGVPFGLGASGAGGAAKGGAIAAVSGQITIVGCQFTTNRVDGGSVSGIKYGGPGGMAIGGAIHAAATLQLAQSTFTGNIAAGGLNNVQTGSGGDALGGALACLFGVNQISDCRLLQNSAIAGRDWASAQGGGIYNTATTTIERTSILTNTALGGRAGRADPTLTKAGNGLGGGLHNRGELILVASTVAFNQAQGGAGIDGCGGCSPAALKLYLDGGDGIGGGIYNAATLRTTNSTIAGNSTVAGAAYVVSPGVGGLPGTTAGSGVFNQTNGVARLIFSTVANNTGAAAAIRTLGSLQAKATIFSAAPQTTNFSGSVSDAGYNLSSDATPSFTAATSRANTNPLLGPLANNGGGILTMALVSGSPAEDAAGCSDSPATDQRGISRPQGAGCDVGAYEASISILASCTESALREAVSAGGRIAFDCDATITLASPLVIARDVILESGGHDVALSGGDLSRIFDVESGASLTVIGIKLVNGTAESGGAIRNNGGSLSLQQCFVANNRALGTSGVRTNAAGTVGGDAMGGAVWNILGRFDAVGCTFSNNVANGGKGGSFLLGNCGGSARGGAVAGPANVTNCLFVDNYARGGDGGDQSFESGGCGGSANGGALYAESFLTRISESTFANNTATGGNVGAGRFGSGPGGNATGGAITVIGGDLWLIDSTVSSNRVAGGVGARGAIGGLARGGAVLCSAGLNVISNSHFNANSAFAGGGRQDAGDGAVGEGGALFNSATTVVERASMTANFAVGAAASSRGAGNGGEGSGGAIFNTLTLRLANSTIAGNRARGGAGGVKEGAGVPTSFAASGNASGGGIANAGQLSIHFSTIADNLAAPGPAATFSFPVLQYGPTGAATGGGIHTRSNFLTILNNSILSNNEGGNASGAFSGSHNISSDPTPLAGLAETLKNTNPQLAALTSNGARTFAMKLLPGSPAVDAADSAACLAVDQLGSSRPRGNGCDLGAVESEFTRFSSLTEASVRSAIANGGVFQFGENGFIPLTAPLVITQPTTLHAGGHLVALSGSQSNRVFEVRPGASLTLVGLNIQDGRSTNGGGILNEGSLTLVGCVIANNVAEGRAGTNGVAGASGKIATAASPGTTPGGNGTDGEPGGAARGGGLLNLGTLVVSNSTFVGNEVIGGKGGSAGFGGRAGYGVDGFGRIRFCDQPGLPGQAGHGGHAFGAALCNEGNATLVGTTLAANSAHGGAGGLGGVGGAVPCAFIDYGSTPAGNGGSANGGAWYNSGSLRIEGSLATENLSWGGTGGDAPEVSGNFGSGKGGDGGSAFGGAGADVGTNLLINSTLEGNRAKGGPSGFSSHVNGLGCPYPGGNGGDGIGGALFSGHAIGLRNVTISDNEVEAGRAVATFPPGCPIEPQFQGQFLGTNGHALGVSLFASNAVSVANSIFAGTSPSNQCVGPMTDLGHNLCSDASAAFASPTSRHNTQPLLNSLANNGGPILTMAPRSDSPAVNAGDDALAPATDQRGVPRPQYARSDIGAVEATFLTIERLANGNVRLRYTGIPGHDYSLEGAPAFGDVWSVLETKPAVANGAVDYSDRPAADAQLLFRVKAP